MLDWVEAVENFRDVVVKGASKTPVGQTGNAQLDVQLSLLRSLVQTKANQKKAKIATNFLAAAMHLAFLRSAAEEKLSLDFPEDASALVKRFVPSFSSCGMDDDQERSIPSSENQIDPDDVEYLEEYTKAAGGPGFAGLRNPLHLALAISPVFLLLPNALSKKHVNRKTLILACVVNIVLCIVNRFLSRRPLHWAMGSHSPCWKSKRRFGGCYYA
jgi:hypothetical protein